MHFRVFVLFFLILQFGTPTFAIRIKKNKAARISKRHGQASTQKAAKKAVAGNREADAGQAIDQRFVEAESALTAQRQYALQTDLQVEELMREKEELAKQISRVDAELQAARTKIEDNIESSNLAAGKKAAAANIAAAQNAATSTEIARSEQSYADASTASAAAAKKGSHEHEVASEEIASLGKPLLKKLRKLLCGIGGCDEVSEPQPAAADEQVEPVFKKLVKPKFTPPRPTKVDDYVSGQHVWLIPRLAREKDQILAQVAQWQTMYNQVHNQQEQAAEKAREGTKEKAAATVAAEMAKAGADIVEWVIQHTHWSFFIICDQDVSSFFDANNGDGNVSFPLDTIQAVASVDTDFGEGGVGLWIEYFVKKPREPRQPAETLMRSIIMWAKNNRKKFVQLEAFTPGGALTLDTLKGYYEKFGFSGNHVEKMKGAPGRSKVLMSVNPSGPLPFYHE